MVKEIRMYQTSDGQTFTDATQAYQHEEEVTKLFKVTLVYKATYTTMVQAKTPREAINKAEEEWYPEDIHFSGLEDYDIDEVKKDEEDDEEVD